MSIYKTFWSKIFDICQSVSQGEYMSVKSPSECLRTDLNYESCVDSIQNGILVPACPNCERAASVLMMERPDLWPLVNQLPLKRAKNTDGSIPLPDTRWGFMSFHAGDSRPAPKVYIQDDQILSYPDYEAIYDAGWRID